MNFRIKNLHITDETDSTNNYANRLIMTESSEEGTAVLTYFQSSGRGQQGNSWESEPSKNLLLSIILRPVFISAENQFILSKTISLGIVDFLSEETENVTIKWPNDIYKGNQKIAGILIENAIMASNIVTSVAGIGLNINQMIFTSDAPNPVSLKMITGVNYPLSEIAEKVYERVMNRYEMLKMGGRKKIEHDYLSNLYRFGEWHWYKSGNKVLEGRICGIGEFGRLLIAKRSGQINSYNFKEVEYII
jgi:BirA family biotin operon repressor/biotin-[acetyl-CoA-carboxylase] ligase